MATIDTLAYKMVLDYSQFTSGMVATRKELSLAKQLTAEFATENEKFAQSMDVLNNLYEKNAIDVKTYDRAVDALIERQKELTAVTAELVDEGTTPFGKSVQTTNPVVEQLAGNILKMGPGLYALEKGLQLASAGWELFKRAAEAAFDAVKQQFFETDALIEQAEMMGTSLGTLVNFQSLGQPMGMAPQQTADAIQKMLTGVGMAAQGLGRLPKIFEQLGLDAKRLRDMAPEQQFMEIAKALRQMDSETQMAFAERIFGTADAVKLLNISMVDLVTNAEELKRIGEPSWLGIKSGVGFTVRGYRSKLDGSVQPYGIAWKTPKGRGDVWCRGRSEKGLELQFMVKQLTNPDPLPVVGACVIYPMGRYCNANKLAGEVDTFEALDHAIKEYPIDSGRIDHARHHCRAAHRADGDPVWR